MSKPIEINRIETMKTTQAVGSLGVFSYLDTKSKPGLRLQMCDEGVFVHYQELVILIPWSNLAMVGVDTGPKK